MSRLDGSQSEAGGSTTGSASRLLQRLADLTELQIELFKVDARDGLRSLSLTVVLLAAGIVIGSGGVLVLLMALAEFLVSAGLSRAVSLLVVGVLGLLLAGGAAWSSWQLAHKVLAAFDRSRAELRTNLAWLKASLKESSSRKGTHDTIRTQD